jgi:hypothetical protein
MKRIARPGLALGLALLAGCLGTSSSFDRHYPVDPLAEAPTPSRTQILKIVQDVAIRRGYIYMPSANEDIAAAYSWHSGNLSVYLTVKTNAAESAYTFQVFSWPSYFLNSEAKALIKQLKAELPASTGKVRYTVTTKPPQRP